MYNSLNYPNFSQPSTVDYNDAIITAIAADYCNQLPSDTKFLDDIVLRAAQSTLGETAYMRLARCAMVRTERRDLADEIAFYLAEVA